MSTELTVAIISQYVYAICPPSTCTVLYVNRQAGKWSNANTALIVPRKGTCSIVWSTEVHLGRALGLTVGSVRSSSSCHQNLTSTQCSDHSNTYIQTLFPPILRNKPTVRTVQTDYYISLLRLFLCSQTWGYHKNHSVHTQPPRSQLRHQIQMKSIPWLRIKTVHDPTKAIRAPYCIITPAGLQDAASLHLMTQWRQALSSHFIYFCDFLAKISITTSYVHSILQYRCILVIVLILLKEGCYLPKMQTIINGFVPLYITNPCLNVIAFSMKFMWFINNSFQYQYVREHNSTFFSDMSINKIAFESKKYMYRM